MDCECLCNEAPDIVVNLVSVSGPNMPLEDQIGIHW